MGFPLVKLLAGDLRAAQFLDGFEGKPKGNQAPGEALPRRDRKGSFLPIGLGVCPRSLLTNMEEPNNASFLAFTESLGEQPSFVVPSIYVHDSGLMSTCGLREG